MLEDDRELRDALAELLEEEGYQVVAVGRGEEAVQKAASQPFDLIVSDIRMDGMDGLEAIDRSRKLQPSMSSLVVSGYATEKETLRALHLNVGGYLRKPFSLKEFLQSVQSVLEKQTLQLRHQREVEGYRAAFAWSIKTLSELCDEAGIPRAEGGLARISHVCEALALKLGLSSGAAQQVSWATVVAILSGQGRSNALLANLGEISKASAFLTQLAGVEKRIVTLGLYLWNQSELPLAEDLPPELLEEGLGSAYQEVRGQVLDQGRDLDLDILRALSDSVQRDRSLLALATALEESKDLVSAAHAYREIVDSKKSQADPILAQALLGLTRLAKKQGAAAADWLERVESCCRALGARSASQVLLEAGLLMGEARLLREAEAMARRAEHPVLAVKARLALLRLGVALDGGDLATEARVLLEPAAKGEWAESWSWLFPLVLEVIENGERPLFRLLLDFSQEVSQLLAGGALTLKARQHLLTCLEGQDTALPEELTEALLKDGQAEVRNRALQFSQRNHREQPAVSLRIQSFGVFQVLCGSRKIPESDWRTQKIKYLLAYLAANGGRRIGEDELIEEFWPETRGSKRNLYVATYEMRRVLRPNPQAKEVDYIVRERGYLYINDQLPVWHDAADCEALLKQGEDIGLCRRLLDLMSGPYLEGCYLEWAVRRRATWNEHGLQACLRLAEHSLTQKQPKEALDFAGRALDVDPGSQLGHLYKLRALLQSRQAEAVIRHFDAAEKLLRKEYELEPSIEMVEAVTRARHGIFE